MKDPFVKCLWCAEDATLLCDAVIGRDAAISALLIDFKDTTITCDAPMCRAHAVAIGHICRVKGGGCGTIDHCAAHRSEFAQGQNLLRRLTIAQATKYREAMERLVIGRSPDEVDRLAFKAAIAGDVSQIMSDV